ncbi:MAG TPA: exonuclease domain-containing protein [Alphaproteobacteria bacterium]|nr:exonuclease domain-containing protein [Alphaproteobacteria bacterium]
MPGPLRRDHRQLSEVTFLAFDTETTGLHPIVHRLVEVAGVCFRLDGRELATFQSLIDPQVPIPKDVQRVHGINDAMVRGQPAVEQIMPRFIEFLGAPDTVLLAHNAPFDLGFLALALLRIGLPCPPHAVFDTLDLTRRCYPIWPGHSLEHVATRLKVAQRAEHRALSDARLVKEIFLGVLQHVRTIRTIADLACFSTPLTFAEAPVCAIAPPPGFEALTTALLERCVITIVYEHGWQRPQARMITPRLVLEVHGVAYVIAHCHLSDAERTFRLDRIRECWLA